MSVKSIKLIAVILLSMVIMTAFVSCDKSDIPDGYQLIACEGDEFRLYVPTQWQSNTSSGVTGAIYSLVENSSVSVTVDKNAQDISAEEYWEACNESLKAELKEYSFSGKTEKSVLGGQPATKSVYSAKIVVNGKEELYKFMQFTAKYKGKMYMLVYSAPEQYYESHIAEFEGNSSGEGIVPFFVFDTPYTNEDNKKEFSDKVTPPDGMKIISTDERPYRFFAPKSWIINNRTEYTAAYVSDTDSSNVSVQMYMTSNENQTVEEYWAELVKSYKNLFSEYSLISSEKIKMDSLDAGKYQIHVVSDGKEYKMLQAIVKKGTVFYCVTYTATSDNYEKHLDDVNKMIESFDIR